MSNSLIVVAHRALSVAPLVALLLPVSAIYAQPAQSQPQDLPGESQAAYLRVVEELGESIALEIAAHRFVPVDGSGPKIGLVGVSHIGERELYDQIQSFLGEYDVVLYESVMPPGAAGAGGDDDEHRRASTTQAMQFVTAAIAMHHDQLGKYPQDQKQLLSFAAGHDPRLEDWLATASVDAWDRPIAYVSPDDHQSYTLVSLGADGKVGGEGADADLEMSNETASETAGLLPQEDNIQAQLASALGLQFQLDAIDYGQPGWRCSDMTIDQLEQAMQEKGVEFGPISGALAGTSWPAKFIGFVLKLVETMDLWMDGAISDTFKVILIEMFSDETILEQGLQQFGAGFEEVIVGQRNQIVIDQIRTILELEPEVESVAVLYGAAHMRDMADRLTSQLGYQATGETWVTAIKVDLKHSAVTPGQLEFLRRMIKQQLKLQRQWGVTPGQPDR
ncbi:MAG: type II secretion system protein GspG [Phycisphaerales bacterium]